MLNMASEAVLKYLVDSNRPYSCADVTVNLRGAYTKTVVQKTLDALSETGKIKCKLYGKQKVYAAIQVDSVADEGDVEGTVIFGSYAINLLVSHECEFILSIELFDINYFFFC